MAVLARLNDFTAGTAAVADDVDSEFDQLVEALNGTKTTLRYILKSNDASNAVLELENVSTGPILDLKTTAGGRLIRITNAGVIDSDVATGTAPLDVASTTMNPNLNADTVDGKHGTALLDSTDPTISEGAGNVTKVTFDHDTEDDIALRSEATNFVIRNVTDALDLVTINQDSGETTIQGQVITNGGDPSGSNALARKAYVDARKTTWSFGAFFEGAFSTGAKSPIFIVPDSASGFTIDRLKAIYQSGTPTGTTTIQVKHRNSSGTVQNTWSISLLSGTSKNVTVEQNVADTVIAPDEQLEIVVSTENGHEDVTVHAQGWQTVF